MDSNQKLLNEIDPLKKDHEIENKQVKGFILEGIKWVEYLGDNLTTIIEVGSGAEYQFTFLQLRRILRVSGFDDYQLEYSLDKVLNYYPVFYDFQRRIIFVKKEKEVKGFIGAAITHIIENYDSELGRCVGDSIEDFDQWYILTGKINDKT